MRFTRPLQTLESFNITVCERNVQVEKCRQVRFYPRPVLASGYCHRLCLCVCINHLLVRTITRHPFKLGSPNLVQRSKSPWLRSLLFWGAVDLDLQGQIQLQTGNWPNFELVQPIIHHLFKLGFPNLAYKCILALLRSLLTRRLIDLELRSHFYIQKLFICIVVVCIETVKQFLVCFNAFQGLFHSLYTSTHGECTSNVE